MSQRPLSSLPRLLMSALVMTAVLAGCNCGDNTSPNPTVPVRNIGVLLGAQTGVTSEAGAQATFPVSLTAKPTANVTLRFESSDATEGTLGTPTLTFTADNWNAPQSLVVTGVNDDAADGTQPYTVTYSATSEDAAYARLSPGKVSLTNTDNDTAGFTVSAISGATTEAGGQATFTVALNSQPTAEVVVNLDSDNTAEGTVAPTSLTFTQVNWKAPQTVTVTGVNDDQADGNKAYAIVFGATSSSDAAYAALTPANVTVSNTDDETAGFTVSAISVPTTEAGGQATFTVVLNSEPRADVTVSFDSDDTTEGTVSPKSLTFTSVDWKAPRTVTVTGVNDDVADGNQPYSILFAATTSTDAAYAALTPDNVNLTNTDDETAGFTVSAVSGPTTEAGGQATFTVVLNSEPTANVTVSFDSNDTTEGTVGTKSLTFTPVNWKAPQTVTVTGANDDVADGNQPYAIVFGAVSSGDAAYAALALVNVNLTNTDDETAGFTVSAISGPTTEAGEQATFTVVLTSEPTADVTVNFDSNDATEGTVSPKSLTFTPANWKAPQTVTVTGVNDDLADGNQLYAIVFAATTSADTAYAAITPGNVAVSNTDNDTAGITVSAISGDTTEAGGQATFTVVLTSEPFDNVTVSFDSNDTTEGTVDLKSLTFTAANWSAPQTVTVTGVNDDVADGVQPYAIVFAATNSTDAAYAAITPGNVNVANTDDDSAGITVSAISGPTTEAGEQATFTVVLTSEPTADVTVNFDSNDVTEGTVDLTSLTFTSVNWKAPQTVTVTGVNDDVADGNQPYAIVFAATGSADVAYATLTPGNVELTNTDNDSAGITVSAISGNTTEAGGTATFTVVLTSEPTADVTVTFDSNDTTEGTVAIKSLLFTSVNWAAPQTVTVTGVNDDLADGSQPYAIVFAATTSADAAYAAITPGNVTVSNTDNDTAGFTVGSISGNTTEAGGTATFTVVLRSQPFSNVTVNFDSNDTTEGTVAPKSLTFTPANWNMAQTATVTGVNDNLADGNQPYAIVFAATTSADATYAALRPANVNLSNTDNDTAGIIVSAISGNTTESGGTATFTVVLRSQPTANVTLGFDSNDLTEGTVNPKSFTFTPANWNVAQTATVTGVDDSEFGDNPSYAIVFTASTSTDPGYAGITPASLTLVNVDNDPPAQCGSYTTLDDPTRSVTYTETVTCDSGIAAGWYRFTGSGGTRMPTSAPPINTCGTHAPGWYSGSLPTTGGTVNGTVCYNWSGNDCNWSNPVTVTECNGFYVYLLSVPVTCQLRYCTTN